MNLFRKFDTIDCMMKTEQNMNKRSAFTLAEVLITLVVVGVIAALTIPTVIYETKKTEYSVRVKKFYSTMSQVVKLAEAKGKSWDVWASGVHDEEKLSSIDTFQREYLLPYISYTKTETIGDIVYVYLNDGSTFYNFKGSCMDFHFDVNGDKKPNKSGRNQFRFLYCPKNDGGWTITSKFIPYQMSEYSRETVLNLCKTNAGFCSTLLMMDGWEFKDDYPYKI